MKENLEGFKIILSVLISFPTKVHTRISYSTFEDNFQIINFPSFNRVGKYLLIGIVGISHDIGVLLQPKLFIWFHLELKLLPYS